MVHPPGPVAPNIAQVDMKYIDATGKKVQNTFHVFRTTGWDEVELDTLASNFETWFTANVLPLVSESLTLKQVVATDLTSLDHSRIALDTSSAGTDATGQVPNNVSFAIKADIGKRGRGRNGRIFVPGLSVDQVLLDNIVPATAAAWVDALDALIVLVAGLSGSPELVVLHRVVGGVKLAIQTFDVIQRWTTTDLELDSQKNRLIGHKRRNKEEAP